MTAPPSGPLRFLPPARSPHHDVVNAAWLGLALGITFTVCFVTGVVSHLVQDPPSWFTWPTRPAGLYRVNQGLHVATGIAAIPLLFVKLWVVYPKLFAWPPVRSVAHAIERLALLPLVGGSLLLVVTGVGNVNIWRPYPFPFRSGHYAAAWLVIGALVLHVAAKWPEARTALRRGGTRPTAEPTDRLDEGEPGAQPPWGLSAGGAGRRRDRQGARRRWGASASEPGAQPPWELTRRAFLGASAAASAAVTLFTVGQTVFPLRRLALLAPRRPDSGPQGFPVNRTAASVGLTDVDLESYRLEVVGEAVATPLSLTYAELRAMEAREATLPIACVEGWSTNQTWRGVPVGDLLALAGAADGAEVTVVALHDNPRQRTSTLSAAEVADPDTLLALEVRGEVLHPDHGFPVRLIGPNRPGVAQTKWVARLEVT